MSSSRKPKDPSPPGPALVFKTWEEKGGKLVPSKRPRTKRGQSKPEVEIATPKDIVPQDNAPNVHPSVGYTPQETTPGEGSPIAALNEGIPELATENVGGASGDSATPERGPPPVRFLICDSISVVLINA